MEDLHPDKMFVKNQFTDFEKLLFAQAEITDLRKENAHLKIEIGKLQSQIHELEDGPDSKLIHSYKSVKGQAAFFQKECKRLHSVIRELTA